MLKTLSRRLLRMGMFLGVVVAIPPAVWFCLTYQPSYYRAINSLSPQQREVKAKRFVAPEPAAPQRHLQRTELGGRLLRSGSQRLARGGPGHAFRRPASARGARSPRSVRAGPGDAGLPAREGGVQSVITVVARPRMPEGNTIELTLEKIRAGILPGSRRRVLDRITEIASGTDVDVESGGSATDTRVVQLQYTPEPRAGTTCSSRTGDPRRSDPPGGSLRPHRGGLPCGRGSPRARSFSRRSRGGTSSSSRPAGSTRLGTAYRCTSPTS